MSDQLYSTAQINAISRELQRRLKDGEANDPTIMVTLVTMAKAGRISQANIQTMLNIIYNDKIKILAVLIDSQKYLDAKLIDDIIHEVEATN